MQSVYMPCHAQELSEGLNNAFEENTYFSHLIGTNSNTNFYWDGKYTIETDDGKTILSTNLIPNTIINGNLYLTDNIWTSYISTDSLYASDDKEYMSLCFKSSIPNIEKHIQINDTISNINIDCSISIVDIPVEWGGREKILNYILCSLDDACANITLGESFMHDLTFDIYDGEGISNMVSFYTAKLLEYAGHCYNDSFNETMSFGYSFEKTFESDKYVTFLETDYGNFLGGSMFSGTTQNCIAFNKHSGEILKLKDVINEEFHEEIYTMAKFYVGKQRTYHNFKSVPAYLSQPIGLSSKGIIINYKFSPETVSSTHIPTCLLCLDYSKIKNYVKDKFHFHFKPTCDLMNVCRVNESQEDIGSKCYSVDSIQAINKRLIIPNEPTMKSRSNMYNLDSIGDNYNKLIYIQDTDFEYGNLIDSLTYLVKKYNERGELKKAEDFALMSVKAHEHNFERDCYFENSHNYYIDSNKMSDFIQKYPWIKLYDISNHNSYFDCLVNMADICYKEKKFTKAAGYYKRAAGFLEYLLIKQFNENQPLNRGEFWHNYSGWYLSELPYLAYSTKDDTLAVIAYNSALVGKGLMLNTERAQRQYIYESNDSTLKWLQIEEDHIKEDLLNLSDNISILYQKLSQTTDNDDIKHMKQKIDTLSHTQNNKVDQLKQVKEDKHERMQTSADFQYFSDIKYKDVTNRLSDYEVAIEFSRHKDGKGKFTYYAMLARKNQTFPKIIRLCTEEELPDVNSSNQDLKKLYDLFWKPLKRELNKVRKIYFSPTGLLHDFSIEYAESPNGQPLNSLYEVYRLSTTAVLANRKKERKLKEQVDNAVLFGGLIYDTNKDFVKRDKANYASQTRGLDKSIDNRYVVNKSQKFSYLPGTKYEVNEIYKLINGSDNFKHATMYLDSLGTENLFKTFSGKHINLIHIATHGGFNGAISETDEIAYGDYNDQDLKNAYLAFAGANTPSDEKTNNDGLVDGFEISILNLSGLKLVVLSACETAKGIISVEGISGLQSAFKKAGAKTLLMSLRNVHDNATRLLMTYFYENLSIGKDINVSLSEAQKRLREYNNGRYSKPYYWANFILLDALSN